MKFKFLGVLLQLFVLLGVVLGLGSSPAWSLTGTASCRAIPAPLPQKVVDLSSVARKLNYRWLIHQTRAKSLVSILKCGALVKKSELPKNLRSSPFTPEDHVPADVVYLELLSPLRKGLSLEKFTNWAEHPESLSPESPVIIAFSPYVLDRGDFYINEGWEFGHESSTTIYPDHTADFMNAFSAQKTASNEVCFRNALPITTDVVIWTYPSSKPELLRILDKAGVTISPWLVSHIQEVSVVP